LDDSFPEIFLGQDFFTMFEDLYQAGSFFNPPIVFVQIRIDNMLFNSALAMGRGIKQKAIVGHKVPHLSS
jgi:hypothetical protein